MFGCIPAPPPPATEGPSSVSSSTIPRAAANPAPYGPGPLSDSLAASCGAASGSQTGTGETVRYFAALGSEADQTFGIYACDLHAFLHATRYRVPVGTTVEVCGVSVDLPGPLFDQVASGGRTLGLCDDGAARFPPQVFQVDTVTPVRVGAIVMHESAWTLRVAGYFDLRRTERSKTVIQLATGLGVFHESTRRDSRCRADFYENELNAWENTGSEPSSGSLTTMIRRAGSDLTWTFQVCPRSEEEIGFQRSQLESAIRAGLGIRADVATRLTRSWSIGGDPGHEVTGRLCDVPIKVERALDGGRPTFRLCDRWPLPAGLRASPDSR